MQTRVPAYNVRYMHSRFARYFRARPRADPASSDVQPHLGGSTAARTRYRATAASNETLAALTLCTHRPRAFSCDSHGYWGFCGFCGPGCRDCRSIGDFHGHTSRVRVRYQTCISAKNQPLGRDEIGRCGSDKCARQDRWYGSSSHCRSRPARNGCPLLISQKEHSHHCASDESAECRTECAQRARFTGAVCIAGTRCSLERLPPFCEKMWTLLASFLAKVRGMEHFHAPQCCADTPCFRQRTLTGRGQVQIDVA